MGEIPRVIDNEGETLERLFSTHFKQFKADTWRFATGFLFFNGWNIVKDSIPPTLKDFYILFGFTDVPFARSLARALDYQVRGLTDEALDALIEDETLTKLIRENKLHLRWLEGLHSKLYLFTKNENDDANFDGKAVVGSSNITRRGLREEGELNVLITDKNDLRLLLEWFKRRWDKGTELTPEVLLRAILNERARRILKQTGTSVDFEEFVPEDVSPRDLAILGYLFLFWYLLKGVYSGKKTDWVKELKENADILDHNIDAIVWGFHIIKTRRQKGYGGVILADPVGLGKSFQALGILYLLSKTDPAKTQKVLLVAPPHLIENGQWIEYIGDMFFKRLGYEVDIDYINLIGSTDSPRLIIRKGRQEMIIDLVSSYLLARINNPEKSDTIREKLSDYGVVIVDEAHHFKNPKAKKRKTLEAIIGAYAEKHNWENPYVILLTATPIINDIWELFSLLSIFTKNYENGQEFWRIAELWADETNVVKEAAEYSRLVRECKGSPDEEARVKACEEKKKKVAILRRFLKEVMVLRSRKYIETHYRYRYHESAKPILKVINVSLDEKMKKLLSLFEKLTFSYLDLLPTQIIAVGTPKLTEEKIEVEKQPVPLKHIMKILLAKRLESSQVSFLLTLNRIKERIIALLPDVESRDLESLAVKLAKPQEKSVEFRLFSEDSRELEEIYSYEENTREIREILNYLREHEGEFPRIEREMKADLKIIEEIFEEFGLGIHKGERILEIDTDTKEDLLKDLLERVVRENKLVVIFTMYVDTAKRLEKLVTEWFGKDGVYMVTGEISNKEEEVRKFKHRKKKGMWGILISTDTLSEGINLKEVDYLVNYDIPWTPSTLMQRVGRLWRVGRKNSFEFYNFLPPKELIDLFPTVTESVKLKEDIIKEILVQEIELLREAKDKSEREREDLLESFEERVYGAIGDLPQKETRDLLLQLASSGAEEFGFLEAKLLQLLKGEKINGKSVTEIIKENEELFKKIKSELEQGNKLLNLSFIGDNYKRIAIVNVGKRYFFDLEEYKIIRDNNEELVFKELKDRWNKIKEAQEPSLTWLDVPPHKGTLTLDILLSSRPLDIENIIEALVTAITDELVSEAETLTLSSVETTLLREMRSAMKPLSLDKNAQLLRRQLLSKLILTVIYHSFARSYRNKARQRILNIFREYGILKGDNKVDRRKLTNLHILQEVVNKITRAFEEPKKEVIVI